MKITRQIFWHTIFWLTIIALFLFLAHRNTKLSTNDLLILFLLYPVINISLFYINFLVYIPQFLDKKRYRSYLLFIVVSIIIYAIGKYGIALIFKESVLEGQDGTITSRAYFLSTIFTNTLFLFLGLALKSIVNRLSNKPFLPDQENVQLSTRLSFMQSQVNPHFLFNSLNSLFSLAYQHSETTPGAIDNLSKVMYYTLYNINSEKISLASELQYLQNYVDLQKVRLGNEAQIEFEIYGQVASQQIAPMLLITFIENAIKHGITNDPACPVHISIKLNKNQLYLYTQNKKHNYNRDSIKGVGINNVKSRFNLLYKGKYNLNISDGSEMHTCELHLTL